MVLGYLPVPGRPTIWITVGQGPTALAVGAGGGCLDIFTLIYPFFPLSPSLWETARYRLKYCLKGPLNPKSTNQLHGMHDRKDPDMTAYLTGILSTRSYHIIHSGKSKNSQKSTKDFRIMEQTLIFKLKLQQFLFSAVCAWSEFNANLK